MWDTQSYGYFFFRSCCEYQRAIPLNTTIGRGWFWKKSYQYENRKLFQFFPLQNTSCLDDFDRIKTLGTGSFGRVMLVQHKAEKVYYAMKILDKQKVSHLKLLHFCNIWDKIVHTWGACSVLIFEIFLQPASRTVSILNWSPTLELSKYRQCFALCKCATD